MWSWDGAGGAIFWRAILSMSLARKLEKVFDFSIIIPSLSFLGS
jgi:hypothetical protein